MAATRDGKMWRCQFYYKDWQGVSHKKNKRGFKTKSEAEQWERDFLQQQQKNLDINFENFVHIYYEDMEHRLRENTMRTKKFIIDLKIIPYFKKKCMNEIKASDIWAWQNALINILTRKLNIGAERLYVDYGIRYESKRVHSSRIVKLTLEQRA